METVGQFASLARAISAVFVPWANFIEDNQINCELLADCSPHDVLDLFQTAQEPALHLLHARQLLGALEQKKAKEIKVLSNEDLVEQVRALGSGGMLFKTAAQQLATHGIDGSGLESADAGDLHRALNIPVLIGRQILAAVQTNCVIRPTTFQAGDNRTGWKRFLPPNPKHPLDVFRAEIAPQLWSSRVMTGVLTEDDFKNYLLEESRKRFLCVTYLASSQALCDNPAARLLQEHSNKSDSHATQARLFKRLADAEKDCSSSLLEASKMKTDLLSSIRALFDQNMSMKPGCAEHHQAYNKLLAQVETRHLELEESIRDLKVQAARILARSGVKKLEAMKASVVERAVKKQVKAKRGRDNNSAGERVALLKKLICEYPTVAEVAALAAGILGNDDDTADAKAIVESAIESLGSIRRRRTHVMEVLEHVSLGMLTHREFARSLEQAGQCCAPCPFVW
jgi:hypothetical protein